MRFSEYVDKVEAKDLIAERTRPQHQTKRAWKNIIDQRLKYQVDTKKITTNSKGELLYRDLYDYVQKKYPGIFPNWQVWPYKIGMPIEINVFEDEKEIEQIFYPSEISDCHNMITELSNDRVGMRRKIQELEDEIAKLRPLAERYQHICKKNTESLVQ